MKKTVVYLLTFLLLFSLAACSSPVLDLLPQPSAAITTEGRPAETEVPPVKTDSPVPVTESTPETTARRQIEIPFTEHYYENTDYNGYVIEQKITVSPWISQNDRELLEAAWEKVGRGKELPSPGSLGISNNRVVSAFGSNYIEYDEVLYAVGQLDVYNRTEGYPITKDNPYSSDVYLSGAHRFNTLTLFYSSGTRTYYSVSGGVFGTQGGGWSPIGIKMVSDHWGPCSFVLALAIDKTPNHPKGDPSYADTVFRFGGESFVLPLLTMDSLNEQPTESTEVWTEPEETDESPAATETQKRLDSISLDIFNSFEGMSRGDLKERYGEPDYDDGGTMTYDFVSWYGYDGNLRFYFDNSAESCKTDFVSWTAYGASEDLFRELCDSLNAMGDPGETFYPKSGQIEKVYLIDGREIVAGNEDSADGQWTYVFSLYHS